MKKFALALALVGVAALSQAATIFDAIYADAAQTTLRGYTVSFVTQNHAAVGFFTTGQATSLASVQFLYANRGTTAIASPFTGFVEIYDTPNPELLTNPNSGASAVSGLISTSTFTQASSLAAGQVGVGGFNLAAPVALQASKTYGFVIKIASATVAAVPTFGDYGTGTVGLPGYNFLNYAPSTTNDFIPTWNGIGFGGAAANKNLGYALYDTALPVPEPASMAVLGLGALAVLRRRKRA